MQRGTQGARQQRRRLSRRSFEMHCCSSAAPIFRTFNTREIWHRPPRIGKSRAVTAVTPRPDANKMAPTARMMPPYGPSRRFEDSAGTVAIGLGADIAWVL